MAIRIRESLSRGKGGVRSGVASSEFQDAGRQGDAMEESRRLQWLRIALLVLGAIATFGFYPLTVLWPSGWVWHTGHYSHYLVMILGIYATLGVFLMIASRNPLAHLSLIWFTVWSSVVHGAIMAAQAVADPTQRGHLVGDVPVLFVAAAVLAYLTPRGGAAKA